MPQPILVRNQKYFAPNVILPPKIDLLEHYPSPENVHDPLKRPIRDLRISLIDRCNFRCRYCMPKEVFTPAYNYLASDKILSFNQIIRLCKIFIGLGVQKIRLTGGEPLLRKGIEELIDQLAKLSTQSGKALDITLTTNGSLLAKMAKSLKSAGLTRVTVSLDALDNTSFQSITDSHYPVERILEGIHQAQAEGLGPIKINMVVKRGTNEDQIIPMANYFRQRGMILRFIEFMDVGNSNGWNISQVVPSREILATLQTHWVLKPLDAHYVGETAKRWGYVNAEGNLDPLAGEVGFISSITEAFCDDCNRIRLSPDGVLYLCLFASTGYDISEWLQPNPTIGDDLISKYIAHIWQQRLDQYSKTRINALKQHPIEFFQKPKIEMSSIGG
ncbi:MAG: GTP 3',8-cyclase MoaA [Gammaproteobacteria bacterium]|nr:GTP 3',8-cyclase MoaA [Gammaproteobacteria bacterium]